MEAVKTNGDVGIKQAVAAAYDFLKNLYADQNISNLMLGSPEKTKFYHGEHRGTRRFLYSNE